MGVMPRPDADADVVAPNKSWLGVDTMSSFVGECTRDMLPEYLSRLVDPIELEKVSLELSNRTFAELEAYYDSQPGLGMFTVSVEQTRMNMIVVTEDGVPVTDADTIREMYAPPADHSHCCGPCELLWRMANQARLTRPCTVRVVSPTQRSPCSNN